jgi:predicted Zn finger-like uncharacterized protein
MALFITQCPHCQTTFRTSVSQLQSADGMVRCGACLRVFVADDHLLPSADLHTLDTTLGAANDSRRPDNETCEIEVPLPDTMEPKTSPPTSAEPVECCESIAPGNQQLGNPEVTKNSALFDLSKATIYGKCTFNGPLPDGLSPQDRAIETPRFSALDDLALTEKSSPHDFVSAIGKEDFDEIAAVCLDVNFDGVGNIGQKSSAGWWAVTAAVLFLGLLMKTVNSLWDELGQNEAIRPWLENFCSKGPCGVSSRVNLESINAENLLVRSHPEISNALRVSLVVRNESEFEQAFPDLVLRFTDGENLPVAQRTFSRTHYLPTELRDLQRMPAGIPIHISLDIIDPGIRAINYEVSFGRDGSL